MKLLKLLILFLGLMPAFAQGQNDRYSLKTKDRFNGRYEGKWDSLHESRISRLKTSAHYSNYHDRQISRAPGYAGVMRIKPPGVANSPALRVVSYQEVYCPYWAPDFSFVRRFIYFPRLDIYWDNFADCFIYYDGYDWRTSRYLPPMYDELDICRESMFEIEERIVESAWGYDYYFYDDGMFYYDFLFEDPDVCVDDFDFFDDCF